MSNFPEPLVPQECDLRDFPYTPLFRSRLFGSSFHARATDAEWRAGVTLWLKSWDQAPAGSLPDDDIDLCRLAELGRDLKTWGKLRTGAMRGWVKCSDGRLHHPVVAEGALEAWSRRQSAKRKGLAGASKRWGSAIAEPSSSDSTANAPAIARAMPGDSNRREEKRIEGKEESTPNPSRGPGPSDDDPGFAAFWETYPRKDAKGDARKAWPKALKRASAADIVAGARGYQFNENPRFIPLPATWLNGERWLQAADSADDGMDPVLRAAGVTQADLDYHLAGSAGQTPNPIGLLR